MNNNINEMIEDCESLLLDAPALLLRSGGGAMKETRKRKREEPTNPYIVCLRSILTCTKYEHVKKKLFSHYNDLYVADTLHPCIHPSNGQKGLFSNAKIRKGEYICVIISRTSADHLRKKGQLYDWSHLRSVSYNEVLDPTPSRCLAQYINDARCSGMPNNTTFCKVNPRTIPTAFVVVRALRDIDQGEELYVSYGTQYWKDFEQRNRSPSEGDEAGTTSVVTSHQDGVGDVKALIQANANIETKDNECGRVHKNQRSDALSFQCASKNCS